MSVSSPTTATVAPSVWQVPRLSQADRVVGGLAAGVAREIGVDPIWIRVGFVVLFSAGGWGGLLYLVAWGVVAWLNYAGRGPASAPIPNGRTSARRMTGVLLVVAGLFVLFTGIGGLASNVVWPMGIVGLGLLIAWHRAAPPAAPLAARRPDRRSSLVQVVGGLVLAAGGGALLVANTADLGGDSGVVYVVLAVGVALALLSAPWWWSVLKELDNERQARARSDERAEVAAHLHDSVLQTLTLIQNNSEDPQTMVNLARRQERELRNWLDPDRASRSGASVRGQLDDLASEIEALLEVPVEVVTVGDCLVDESIGAALAATREAVMNAARHSGASRVDVYAEIRDGAVEIFVRDTGVGFDPDAVAEDRRGIAESIEGRMRRAGGRAVVMSSPEEGTEVEISVAREGAEP